MNDELFELFDKVVPTNLISNARNNRKSLEKDFRILIEQKKWPLDGWREGAISLLLSELALMDSNNWKPLCGMGEREGRVICPLVASWHLGLSHGIGRSGDIAEVQPKAIGSSILMKMTNALATDALKTIGLQSIGAAIVVPIATGMALMLCLLALKQERGSCACFVLWSRCDQKSAIKAVHSAGLELKVVNLEVNGTELRTDVAMFESLVEEVGGAQRVCCFLTTTSCFAPRSPDRIDEVAMLARKFNIPHVVNNAYGLQSSKCIHLIQQGMREGGVNLVVQSTDKNFLVPVGGSIIASPCRSLLQRVAQMYPGRASSTAHVDLLATLLHLGRHGYVSLLQQRSVVFQHLLASLTTVALQFNQRVIYHKPNSISIGMTLDGLSGSQATMVGSMLNTRNVSGARVVARDETKVIYGTKWAGFGAHTPSYPHHYLTAAATLGSSHQQVDFFIHKLTEVLVTVYDTTSATATVTATASAAATTLANNIVSSIASTTATAHHSPSNSAADKIPTATSASNITDVISAVDRIPACSKHNSTSDISGGIGANNI